MKKKIFSVISLFMILTIAVAYASIKADMKTIGTDFRTITLSVNNPASNAANIVLADKIIASFKSLREINPGMGSFNEYQSLIDREITLFNDLKKNLSEADQASALATIEQINLVKKEAHNKFK